MNRKQRKEKIKGITMSRDSTRKLRLKEEKAREEYRWTKAQEAAEAVKAKLDAEFLEMRLKLEAYNTPKTTVDAW